MSARAPKSLHFPKLVESLFIAVGIASVTASACFAAHEVGTTPHPPSSFLQGYNTGTGKCTFVSSHGHSTFLLQNTNHNYNCADESCGDSAGVQFVFKSLPILKNVTFSLSNGTNGTVNLYLLTGQSPIPTYSVSFSQLTSGTFVVTPSQFNPPVQQGNIGLLVVDANPCQQVTVQSIRINGQSGNVIPTPSTECNSFVCQPPN
ncbi:hypothetical protein BH10CYA1_BH10CYA1_39560 [soil metagenome]